MRLRFLNALCVNKLKPSVFWVSHSFLFSVPFISFKPQIDFLVRLFVQRKSNGFFRGSTFAKIRLSPFRCWV